MGQIPVFPELLRSVAVGPVWQGKDSLVDLDGSLLMLPVLGQVDTENPVIEFSFYMFLVHVVRQTKGPLVAAVTAFNAMVFFLFVLLLGFTFTFT